MSGVLSNAQLRFQPWQPREHTITRENAPSSDVRSTHDLTQNPSGYIVLRTESGNITESHLTANDKANFAQVAQYAYEHPIGRKAQVMATVGRGIDR